jgi:hypothetical protein
MARTRWTIMPLVLATAVTDLSQLIDTGFGAIDTLDIPLLNRFVAQDHS